MLEMDLMKYSVCHLQWIQHSSSWQTVWAFLLIVCGTLGTLHHNSMRSKYAPPISLEEIIRNMKPKSIFYSVSVCSLSLVPINQLLSVAAACKVLIEFSLMRLENPDEACAVSQVRNGKCTANIHFEAEKSTEDVTNVFVGSSTETPDSSNKRTLHRLQQAGSHRNHHFHCYDEICKVASNRQDPFRWSVSHKVHEYLNSTKMIPCFFLNE